MRDEKHLVLDIETMDTGPQAAVVNIGARMFTIDKGPGKGFEVFIEPGQAAKIGTVSDDTMKWWSKQPTRAQVFGGMVDPVTAAYRLVEFCKSQEAELIWANSPSFDCVILRYLFSQVNLDFPFRFWAERDCRTVSNLGRSLQIDCQDLLTNPARRSHLALDDATLQAEITHRILGRILSKPASRAGRGSSPTRDAPPPSAAADASTASG